VILCITRGGRGGGCQARWWRTQPSNSNS